VDGAKIPFLLGAAILVSFFPCGILFPFEYPVREIATLLIWVCAFPSLIGCASVLLLPLLPSESYGYFAFNLFCVMATFATGWRIAQRGVAQVPTERLYRLARACLLISLALAAWQAVDGEAWLRAFPAMFAIGHGRGSGLRTEPSLLAPPLAMFLLFGHLSRTRSQEETEERWPRSVEIWFFALATLVLTRSLTVAIVLLCFLPAFAVKLRTFVGVGIAGALAAGTLFWGRLHDAFSGGSDFIDLITTAVGSWRNIPDILIVANARDFLVPTNPGELREKIQVFAAIWNPGWMWIENTYSTFSAAASTIGLVGTAMLFLTGIRFGLRRTADEGHIRVAWLMLYVANWFILPKYEPCGWIVLGLLTAASSVSTQKVFEIPARLDAAEAS
jgi:hypothetical protein